MPTNSGEVTFVRKRVIVLAYVLFLVVHGEDTTHKKIKDILIVIRN